jgi:hypothetical protein
MDFAGERFDPAATARVNGQSRAVQFVSPTAVRVQLSPSDVAVAGTTNVVVINPGGIESAPAALPVLSSVASLTQVALVSLANRDVVYDSVRKVFYVSVRGSVANRGNTVTRVTATGEIQASVSVGKEPGKMAISDDGQFLYVALTGEPGVARVDLATFTRDIVFQLGTDEINGAPLYAEDLVVVPRNAHRVVVARRNTCCSPHADGVALFIDGVKAPVATPGHLGSNRITTAGAVDRVYGVNTEGGGGMYRLLVSDDGVRIESFAALFMCCEIASGGGRIYTDAGIIADARTMTQVGTLSATGLVRPDPGSGRIHVLVGSRILTFNNASLSQIAAPFTLALISGLNAFVRWGTDGLALGGGDYVVILRGELAGP